MLELLLPVELSVASAGFVVVVIVVCEEDNVEAESEEEEEDEEVVVALREFNIYSAISIVPFEYTSEDSPKSSNPFVAATSISVDSRPGYPPIRKNSAAALG